MPSPFPGMDPWLEDPAIFPDVHNSFIARLRDAINVQLPPPYYTAIANRVWVDSAFRFIEPDVNVLYPAERGIAEPGAVAVAKEVMTLPLHIHAPAVIQHDETSEWFLEIFAKPENQQLITTIELLSLSNKKPGAKGRDLYLQKQEEILSSRVHLVEMDFLRGGSHSTAVPRSLIEKKIGPFDYHVLIHLFDQPGEFLAYPWQLAARLPCIQIPLLPGDPVVVVDLQPILDQCYDAGLYRRRTHYRTQPPKPPLTPEQEAWADKLLQAQGM